MNENGKYVLTKEGLAEIKRELEKLYKERKKIAAAIKEARSYGDISENSEYTDAKEKQGLLEGRIAELEDIVRNHVISDNSCQSNKICVGSKVKIKQSGKEFAYTLVGATQANPQEGKISIDSPVGKALLNHTVGDKVEIMAPRGKVQMEIVGVG
ncbi:transcription elongation factor GreA [Patescibacteria group bacterium]|nr:transcription elongation factor GreA [Patescibacteria group bacterium]